MRRSFLILALFASIAITYVSGCKKDNYKPEENNVVIQPENANPGESSRDGLSVSNYGFLVFPNLTSFNEYREFLLGHTHLEVKEYLAQIRFSSLGALMYGREYDSQLVTEEQSVNYLMSVNKVFQVDNAIMRPIGEKNAAVTWEFLLVMTPEYLNGASFENLAAGRYDATTMDKFATNPLDETVDLLKFIQKTPIGYEETVSYTEMARRPMFGSVTNTWVNSSGPHYNAGTGNCQVCHERIRQTTTYIFWIGFPGEEYVVGSWCTEVEPGYCE